MAQKRMFSKHITNDERFLEMPLSSQALYFHLNMNADDDGFVQPKRIIRMVGAKDDDLKVLEAKGFILSIPNTDSVIVITHWKVNNTLRKDRYTESYYAEHLKMLGTAENMTYLPSWQPNGNQMATQDRIGKDREGKKRQEYIPEKKERKPRIPTPIEQLYYDFYKAASGSDAKLSGTEYVILNKYAKEYSDFSDRLKTYFSMEWVKEYDYSIRAFVKVETQRHIQKEMGKAKYADDKEATKNEYDAIVKKLNAYGDVNPEILEKEIRPLEKQRDRLREKLYRMHVL